MTPDPVIELRDVTKVYRLGEVRVEALRGVSLTIRAGDFVAIMGPSGSGKSTLMHILGLLDVPDRGSYRLLGVDVGTRDDAELARLRNEVFGFVFQQFNLLPRTNALENTALPLLYSRERHDPARVTAMLRDVGLGDRMNHRPTELSGGQQQRVAIARALTTDPTIILADEPTGNLDSASANEIMGLLHKLNERGMTIVLVTHERDIADHARRVIHMRDGVISNVEERDAKPRPGAAARMRPASATSLAHDLRAIVSYFRLALRSLVAHKVRALLSMLGILIGVASVIAMMALGAGARESIRTQFSSLGSNLLILRPGARESMGVRMQVGEVSRMTMDDATAIADKVPHIRRVAANVSTRGQVVFGGKNWNTDVTGTTPDEAPIRAWEPAVGRFVTSDDVLKRARVAVVGMTVVRELFGNQNPLGQFIRINRVIFQVVGVLPEKGATGWRDRDDVVIIPVTTGMYRLAGKDYLDSIDIEVDEPQNVDAAQQAVLALMKKRHRIPGNSDEAYSVRNMAEMLAALTETSRTMSLLLSSIAAISLVVGGIGIMNIMLVSVTERVREIGIRKAVGARRRDILGQFLVEAVAVSVTGGLIGIALGCGIALALSTFAGWAATVTGRAVSLAFGFSVLTGLVFGLWPARRAAMLNPIDALRYE